MTPPFYIDCESWSTVPIKSGFMNYVEGAEVMLVSYASGDDDVGLGLGAPRDHESGGQRPTLVAERQAPAQARSPAAASNSR